MFDQYRFLRRGVDDKPGINGDTVPPDTGTGFQNVDPRVSVCKGDDFPHIDVESVADNREFVGKCYLNIPGGIFGEFAHLGCPGVGFKDLAGYKGPVKLGDFF